MLLISRLEDELQVAKQAVEDLADAEASHREQATLLQSKIKVMQLAPINLSHHDHRDCSHAHYPHCSHAHCYTATLADESHTAILNT